MKIQVFGILCLSLVLFHILLLIEASCPSMKRIKPSKCDEKKVPKEINVSISSENPIGNCKKGPPSKKRKETCFDPKNPGNVEDGKFACLRFDKETRQLINDKTGDTYALELEKPGDSTPQEFCSAFEDQDNQFLKDLVPHIDLTDAPGSFKKILCNGMCDSENPNPGFVRFKSGDKTYIVPGSAIMNMGDFKESLKIVQCETTEPPRHSSNCPFYDSQTNGKSKDDQTGQSNQIMQPGESGLTKIPETQKSSSGLSPETLNCPPNSLSQVPVGATMNGIPVGPTMNNVPVGPTLNNVAVGPCANPQNTGPYANQQNTGPYANPQNTGPYANPQNTGPCANQQKG